MGIPDFKIRISDLVAGNPVVPTLISSGSSLTAMVVPFDLISPSRQ